MSSDDNNRALYDPTAAGPEIGLRPVVEREFAPTGVAVAPGDPNRKYVLDQPGLVLVLEDGEFREAPFLDIRDRVVDLKWGTTNGGSSVWGGSEYPGRGVPGESDRLQRWEG